MIGRWCAAAAVLAIAATAVPAVAQAAPVDPARALLTQPEFPAGNTGYRVINQTEPEIGTSSGLTETACESARAQAVFASAGARSSEAVAQVGRTYASVTVTDRPATAHVRKLVSACASEAAMPAPVAAPADLAGYRPWIGSMNGGKEIQASVDVRGVNVAVLVDAAPNPDHATFWQLLRTQVSKIERQP